jgi:hypothetical protein
MKLYYAKYALLRCFGKIKKQKRKLPHPMFNATDMFPEQRHINPDINTYL